MRLSTIALVAAVVLTACPSSTTGTGQEVDAAVASAGDAGSTQGAMDAGPREDGSVSVVTDAGHTDSPDAAMAQPMDAGHSSPDAGQTAPDASMMSQSDAGSVENRPAGQCVVDSDCPMNALGPMCSRTLPGGACLGCGGDGECPGTTMCGSFGNCVQECSEDVDCPRGLRCGGTGLCRALECVNNVCPDAIFGCSGSGLCERRACSTQDECAAGTTCMSGRCIE